MGTIPEKVKKQLESDPFMEKCRYKSCGNPNVEWNHSIVFFGKALQEWYAIVPVCSKHHRGNFGTIFPDVALYCEWLAIKRGLEELKRDYPKHDWDQRLKYLNTKYAK